MRLARLTLLACALGAWPAISGAQRPDTLPYRDVRRPTEQRVRDLLSRMTVEEKFWQLFMIPGDLDNPADDYSHGVFGLQIRQPPATPRDTARDADAARKHAGRINSIQRYFVEQTRLGIPIIPFEEALHGLSADGATSFPQAIGLAASWDTALVSRVAGAIARETAARGIRQALSPVINLATDARWGRVEETYGEDPVLSSLMGEMYVRAMEQTGVIATPKHFIANVGDGGRDSYPIDVSRRFLEEMYFPPFKAVVQKAHARSVMSAYNSVDGAPATQSRMLLTDVLKREWGFSGFVISDAAATGGATVLHMTEASTASATKDAFDAGLDVIFQSSYEQHRAYLAAFQRGLIPDSVMNGSVARVLRAKFELGLFDRPYVDEAGAALWNGKRENRELAREAARKSVVLLKNEHQRLPLRKTIHSIAVIGTDAVEKRLGGYSGRGNNPVSILDGIREAVGRKAVVAYTEGPGRFVRELVAVPSGQLSTTVDGKSIRGLKGEYFDNNRLDGTPKLIRADDKVDFGWTLSSPARGIPFDWYSIRWTGRLTVPARGIALKQLGVRGNDGYRLYLDGKIIIDNWHKQSFNVRTADVHLAPGSMHDIKLEYFESTGNARIRLVWDANVPDDWQFRTAKAVKAARESDVAVVVVGVEEGEFRDRSSLRLPGHQEELIERVAAAGKPVVVVIVGGSAVTMSRWIDRVDAIVDAWYPGEEGGHAIADVLFGDANPGGRLPITFPMSEGQLPLYYDHKPTGRGDDYLDGTGQPLFPFGFGLSYTSFTYSALQINPAEVGPAGTATVRCTVKNTGSRAGDEVVQLYIRDVLASLARPVMQLEGFQRIHLAPGEQRELTFTLGPEQLQMLDRDMKWIVEPGAFRVMIGSSSKDIRLRGELVVH